MKRKSKQVSDARVAQILANGHPKSKAVRAAPYPMVMSGSPGNGAAPGANGPPTTGAITPGGPLGST